MDRFLIRLQWLALLVPFHVILIAICYDFPALAAYFDDWQAASGEKQLYLSRFVAVFEPAASRFTEDLIAQFGDRVRDGKPWFVVRTLIALLVSTALLVGLCLVVILARGLREEVRLFRIAFPYMSLFLKRAGGSTKLEFVRAGRTFFEAENLMWAYWRILAPTKWERRPLNHRKVPSPDAGYRFILGCLWLVIVIVVILPLYLVGRIIPSTVKHVFWLGLVAVLAYVAAKSAGYQPVWLENRDLSDVRARLQEISPLFGVSAGVGLLFLLILRARTKHDTADLEHYL